LAFRGQQQQLFISSRRRQAYFWNTKQTDELSGEMKRAMRAKLIELVSLHIRIKHVKSPRKLIYEGFSAKRNGEKLILRSF
jgi:hypothetical protein